MTRLRGYFRLFNGNFRGSIFAVFVQSHVTAVTFRKIFISSNYYLFLSPALSWYYVSFNRVTLRFDYYNVPHVNVPDSVFLFLPWNLTNQQQWKWNHHQQRWNDEGAIKFDIRYRLIFKMLFIITLKLSIFHLSNL